MKYDKSDMIGLVILDEWSHELLIPIYDVCIKFWNKLRIY